MNKIFCLIVAILLGSNDAFTQDKILWDGEFPNPAACNLAYSSILSGPDAHSGSYYFRAEPDNAHMPRLAFNCTGAWRTDISGFDELRFFIKSNISDQSTSVRFTTYYAKSKWVDLTAFIQGGGLINASYKEVRIPLHLFKTADYDLSSVEYLELATSSVAQTYYYLDDIKVADSKPPLVSFEPVSSSIAKLNVSERLDTTDIYNVSHYSVISTDDPDYQIVTHPIKVGRHSFVSGIIPVSGIPIIVFQLFLIFEKPLKNDVSYTLHAGSLKDISGNVGSLDTTFTFSDHSISGNVKVNQVGYLPESPKLGKLGNFLGDAWFMPIDTINEPVFQIINEADVPVFTGNTTYLKSDSSFSGERVFELDFTNFETPGNYYLYVPGYGRSGNFSIATNIYDQPYYHATRALFYQRSGKLNAENAGQWAREGLPALNAEIHSSHPASPLYNATDYPPGTKIPMSKGWLDAGDYGRYIPTAASALFILFTAYELYPQKFPDKFLNIPESGNNIPDILDELKYETDWMKEMQAPDGGVYFRVTPATWSTGLPGDENNTLYVSEKTTQSTAMFAAAMAMAARNFKNHFPVYADSCLNRAEKAWQFLQAHSQASAPVNVPGISAGPYPDSEDRDNRAWAAAELYKTTGEVQYNADFLYWYGQIPHQFHATMSWQQHIVKAAWAYATTTFPTDPAPVIEFKNKIETEILVNYFNRTMTTHAYHGAYHPFKGFVGYGTFGMAQSYAFDYIMFSYLLDKPELLDLAKVQLDIPLGNNPLSQSYITGLGKYSPQLPLHWSTVPNKFNQPVPGIPVFGPAGSLVMNRPSSFAIQDSANRYPYGFKKEAPYPVLRRYTDAREAVEMSEFTIQEIAVTAAVFAFFSSVISDALPVKLANFEAKNVDCNVALHWITSEESNSDFFAVERSADSKNFVEIGHLQATGSEKSMQSYAFTDSVPGKKNYYRLRQVDLDGKFELSRIVFARDICGNVKIRISQPKLNVYELNVDDTETSDGNLLGTLYNIQGIQKHEFTLKPAAASFLDCTGLTSGIYILKVRNALNETVLTKKLPVY